MGNGPGWITRKPRSDQLMSCRQATERAPSQKPPVGGSSRTGLRLFADEVTRTRTVPPSA
ncbi:hypothetical protein A5678_09970 [Mycobacterium sp. E2733]|nr:hypothetical protein A5678_09970 [Mycobacterium sp. E2733]